MHQPVQINNLKFIRLVTGEDIVSEVSESQDTVQLVNPLKIVYSINEVTGMMSISLMQWVFTRITKEQRFEIPKINILMMSEPSQHMVEYYIKTSSKFYDEIKPSEKKSNPYPEEDDLVNLPELDSEEMEDLQRIMKDIMDGKRRLH
jgi:hypothetical protein